MNIEKEDVTKQNDDKPSYLTTRLKKARKEFIKQNIGERFMNAIMELFEEDDWKIVENILINSKSDVLIILQLKCELGEVTLCYDNKTLYVTDSLDDDYYLAIAQQYSWIPELVKKLAFIEEVIKITSVSSNMIFDIDVDAKTIIEKPAEHTGEPTQVTGNPVGADLVRYIVKIITKGF